MWKSSGSAAPQNLIAYFYQSTCPNGWIAANGASGTPDLRGEFIRGLDAGRGVDNGRGLGTGQAARAGSFTYRIFGDDGDGQVSGSWNSTRQMMINGISTGDAPRSGWGGEHTATVTPGDTRPRNVALLACMKQ